LYYGFDNLCSSDDISHHGIKGQRWGVMHGPPYPLSTTKHNSVVKKSKKERPSGSSEDKTSESKKSSGIDTDKMKKVAIGVGVVAALTAAGIGTAYVIKKNGLIDVADFVDGPLDIDNLSDVVKEIHPGTTFMRVSPSKVENYTKIGWDASNGIKTTNTAAGFAKELVNAKKTYPGDNPYIHKYVLKKDVTVGSEKELFESIKGVFYNGHDRPYYKDLETILSSDPEGNVDKRTYNLFLNKMFSSSDQKSQTFIHDLELSMKQMGSGADAVTAPDGSLLIFKPDKVFDMKSSTGKKSGAITKVFSVLKS
jgi:hypothetical protein